MIYKTVIEALKKHFYLTSREKYISKFSGRHLERIVAKHPLLTPKLIVVNDQPYGFKKLSRQHKSLEQFHINCEIEYMIEEDDIESEDEFSVIEGFDLFSEVTVSLGGKISALQSLVTHYQKYVSVDRVKRMGVEDESSLLIYSTLGDLFSDRYLEEEIEDGLLTEESLDAMIHSHLSHFANFVKFCDDLLIKGKQFSSLQKKLFPK